MQPNYFSIEIFLILIIVYFTTFILSKNKIRLIVIHRKIWNLLLLITFCLSGLLGILLVIQSNYEIIIPLNSEILIWYAHLSVSVFLIGLFHLAWHFKYFANIFKKENIIFDKEHKSKQILKEKKSGKFKISKTDFLVIFILGFVTLISQVILLREFLSIFNGNELVIGIILCNWMLITGFGAYVGKHFHRIKNILKIIIPALFVLALLPIIIVFLINYLKNIVYPIGTMISLIQILYSSFVLLLPFCFTAGLLFTLISRYFSDKYEENLISKIYGYEAIGSIVGGLLFNFLLIYILSTFQILTLISVVSLTILFVFANKVGKYFLAYSGVFITVGIVLLNFSFDLDKEVKSFLYVNQNIEFIQDTPFGNLVITKQQDQFNYFENSNLLFTTNSILENEEAVHYAMLQHKNPKKVLLISGGISGMTEEILKYNVERIDYVEINPAIIDLGKKYTNALNSIRINSIVKDPRIFLKSIDSLYDVILINLPEPYTMQINRYYTIEFFTEIKNHLNDSGVVATSLSSTENYLSEEAQNINSILYHTIKQIFLNILIINGGKNYFIFSDCGLSIDIPNLVKSKEINNVYVNQYYLDTLTMQQRSDFILSKLKDDVDINTDFEPKAYFHQLLFWLSHFDFNYFIIIGIAVFIFVIIFWKLNPITFGIFAAGFSASSFEMILILAFQIFFGYIYQTIGIVITIFMLGLAIGALLHKKILKHIDYNSFLKTQILIFIYSILVPVVLILFKNIAAVNFVLQLFLGLMIFVIALLVGIQFSIASKIQVENISKSAGVLYGVDLLGSAISILVLILFLIPILGIIYVGFIIAILDLLSIFICVINRKRYLGN
ncbi:MAG: fused MFS/spermidine synthase [Ignavibacteriales bacterium]|nr:fused MFS/spermidine synthase [Ignavibacteriales bacterium]